jgi:glutathione S-transferase
MSRPIVYGQPFHLHVRSVHIALREKAVSYRPEPNERLTIVDRDASRISQFGEPVLDVAGFVVEGVETILRYVAEGFSGPALQPSDPRDRVRMNRALELNYAEAGTTLGYKVAGRYLAGVFSHEWMDPELSNDILREAGKTVGAFERLLRDDPFLAGQTYSIADIAVSALLDNIIDTPASELVLPQGSKLRDWWDRVSARPAFVATRPKGGALFGFWYANSSSEPAVSNYDRSG